METRLRIVDEEWWYVLEGADHAFATCLFNLFVSASPNCFVKPLSSCIFWVLLFLLADFALIFILLFILCLCVVKSVVSHRKYSKFKGFFKASSVNLKSIKLFIMLIRNACKLALVWINVDYHSRTYKYKHRQNLNKYRKYLNFDLAAAIKSWHHRGTFCNILTWDIFWYVSIVPPRPPPHPSFSTTSRQAKEW